MKEYGGPFAEWERAERIRANGRGVRRIVGASAEIRQPTTAERSDDIAFRSAIARYESSKLRERSVRIRLDARSIREPGEEERHV